MALNNEEQAVAEAAAAAASEARRCELRAISQQAIETADAAGFSSFELIEAIEDFYHPCRGL